MDKTNVTIKMHGKLLGEDENFLDIDEQKLVERLIDFLQTRKNMINVSFQSKDNVAKNTVATTTKVEILLADKNGAFNYYED